MTLQGKTVKPFLKPCLGLACLAVLMAGGTARAHYLWIEPGAAETRLYYGEADGLLKEKSPGKLDNIKAPKAFVVSSQDGVSNAVAINRTAEYFAIGDGKAVPAILAVEESLEVRDLTKHGLGIAKSNYYARYGQPAASNRATPLALDVQQRGENSYTVMYRGQPLMNAKLEVIAPNTWVQEHKTDAQGAVEINTPWRGQYVIHILHVDKTPGEFAGMKYENLRNHFTYAFIKADGAEPGPAVPPKHGAD